jgi:uncharacterized protein
MDGGVAWMTAACWVGIALAVVSLVAALALEVERATSRTVLPLRRTGAGERVSGLH